MTIITLNAHVFVEMINNIFLSPDEKNLMAPPQVLLKAALSQLQKRVAAVARSKTYEGLKVIVDKSNNMVCKNLINIERKMILILLLGGQTLILDDVSIHENGGDTRMVIPMMVKTMMVSTLYELLVFISDVNVHSPAESDLFS